ncbi:MAG TPA: hypothetical protein VM658_10160 [bacterium]|nr:hypothetical protein [bacterium]
MENWNEGGKKGSGCSFLPWMIVVFLLFIILLLAAIAIPDFMKFQSKGNCIMAKPNLRSIFEAQEKYFEEHHGYAGGKNCFEELKWKPDCKQLYTYYCGEDKILCTRCKEECLTPNLSAASARGFTIMASGNVDNDPGCDVWTINDAKVMKNVIVDP